MKRVAELESRLEEESAEAKRHVTSIQEQLTSQLDAERLARIEQEKRAQELLSARKKEEVRSRQLEDELVAERQLAASLAQLLARVLFG